MIIGEYLPPARAVIVTVVYIVQPGVREVQAFVGVVYRQTVGPVKLLRDYDSPARPIHTRPFYPRILSPVRPKDESSSVNKIDRLKFSFFLCF